MDLKLISKNNIGVVSILVLVLVLSQSRSVDFLLETHLGRIILLVSIIFISCTNKMFGLLAVLCVIIAFNHVFPNNVVHSYNYYEGFDVSGNINDMSGNIASKISAKKQSIADKINSSSTSTNTNNTTNTTSTSSNTESFKGREGFCMSDRELNILRGKRSNAIPVSNSREQVDDVEPSDKSLFSSSYASF
jgi:hypothetical protein